MSRGVWVVLLALAALALGATGCGGDGEDGTSSVPDITVPKGEAETDTTTIETETTTGSSGGTGYDPAKPDSPTNDIPPEPNTPEAKFEEFCKQNPGVCG